MSAKSKKGKNKTEDCTGMITRSIGIHSIETGDLNLEQDNSNVMQNDQDSSVDIDNQNLGNTITNASSSQTSSTIYLYIYIYK